MRVGLNLTTIGVEARWWLEAAARAEQVGIDAVYAFDHFISRGRLTDPVLECWTMLAAAAGTTEHIRLGSWVTNVMNRHPAVLARMVATVADLAPGRVTLGIGIGGHPAEHAAYGLEYPEAVERAARLEEAVTVLRLLWSGGPVDHAGRFFRLSGAHAFPVPQPQVRIMVAGETVAGARLAARAGDAWTCPSAAFDWLAPVFREELERVGRGESDVPIVVGVTAKAALGDLRGLLAEWSSKGVDELIVSRVRPAELDALLEAAAAQG